MQIMNGFHYYYSKSSLSYDANKGVSWIDYDKLGNPIRVQFTDHSIMEHVYAADGRKKEPHPNPSQGVGIVYFAIIESKNLQKSSAIQKISVTLSSVNISGIL